MKIIKLHSDKSTYKNPQELTPNQKKWLSRYVDLSGDEWDAVIEPPAEYHEVYEWENGWCDYTVEDEVLWIWTLYSHNDGEEDGLKKGKGGEAMEVAVKIAKENGCQYIDFDTHRTTKEWKTSTKKHGKLEVKSRELRVVLKKNKKK